MHLLIMGVELLTMLIAFSLWATKPYHLPPPPPPPPGLLRDGPIVCIDG